MRHTGFQGSSAAEGSQPDHDWPQRQVLAATTASRQRGFHWIREGPDRRVVKQMRAAGTTAERVEWVTRKEPLVWLADALCGAYRDSCAEGPVDLHAIKLIEKPLAADVAGATLLMETFRDLGVLGAVGHIERYNPALQQCRRRLENGDLGEVFQVATRRQGPFPARISDVGVVKDLGTHDIDLTAWVTQQTFVSVAAQTAHRSGRIHEDLVSVTGLLTGGIVTSHLVNWLSPLKERKTVVTGEAGAFVVDTLTADLTFYANGLVMTDWETVARFRGVSEGDVTRFAFAKPEPLRSEHEAFRDAVLGKPADIVTLEQGLATVAVAQAVLESATSGRTVTI